MSKKKGRKRSPKKKKTTQTEKAEPRKQDEAAEATPNGQQCGDGEGGGTAVVVTDEPETLAHLVGAGNREKAYLRTLIILAAMFGAVYIFYQLRSVLAPIFLALVIAYILDPVIDRFERHGISRTTAIIILLGVLVVLFGLLALLLVPQLAKSVHDLVEIIKKLPGEVQKLEGWARETFKMKDLPKTWSQALSQWGDKVEQIAPKAFKPLATVAKTVFSSSVNLVLSLVNVILVPLYSFYFLRDFDRITSWIEKIIPVRYRKAVLTRAKKADEVLSAFIRGQLIVAMIVGVLYGVLLNCLGVPMASAIAIFGGAFNIVPYVGFFTTLIFATLAAVLGLGVWWKVLLVVLGMTGIHLLDAFFLTPRIVGGKVGLSSVTVIIAILAGGTLFGFLGILLAVPIAAILNVLWKDFRRWYESTRFFTAE